METTSNIIVQATSAAFFAKILVDALKKSPVPTPSWVVLVLAFVFSEGSAFLLGLMMNQEFNKAGIASMILSGVVAFGSAIGVTELQRTADKEQLQSK